MAKGSTGIKPISLAALLASYYSTMTGPDASCSDTEILSAFLADSDPAYTVAEIAEKLDLNPETVRHQIKQQQLVERGLLERKKPGQRTVLYWISDAGVRYYASSTGND